MPLQKGFGITKFGQDFIFGHDLCKSGVFDCIGK
jgi:hypothetical protein